MHVRSILIALLLAPCAFADVPVSSPNYIAAHDQIYSAAAANNDGFFVVWSDHRSGGAGVYGARFTADGRVLDPHGIFLGYGNGPMTVVWSGRNWLVFFYESVWPAVRMVVVDGDGHHFDPRVVIGYTWQFSVASNGALTVLVDSDGALLFDADGALLETRALPPSQAPGYVSRGDPRIASNGDGFYVIWGLHVRSTSGAEGARLDRNARPLDPKAVSLCGAGIIGVQVYAQGRDYLMVGDDETSAGSLVRHIGEDGSLGPLEVQRRWNETTIPAGDHFIDTAIDRFSLEQTGLDPTLVLRVFDRYRIPIDEFRASNALSPISQQAPLVLAANRTNVLAVWLDDLRLTPYMPMSRLMAISFDLRSHQPSAVTSVSTVAASQSPAGIAAGGSGYAVAWQEDTGRFLTLPGNVIDRCFDSYVARVDAAGHSTAVTRLNRSGVCAIAPRVAWNGTSFDVAWLELSSGRDRVLKTNRIDREGTLIDAEAQVFGASGCANDFDIASNGDVALVAWTDCGLGNIFVARLRNGHLLDWVPLKLSISDHASRPRVAWNGEAFVVAWLENDGVFFSIARITPELTLLDPHAINVPNPMAEDGPAIASSGHESLIVYEGSSNEVQARFLANDGTLSEPVLFNPVSRFATHIAPSVTWDGSNYVIAWSLFPGSLSFARLGRNGEIQPGIDSTYAAPGSTSPLLASSNGSTLLAYVRSTIEAPFFGSDRVFLRLLPVSP